MLAVDFFHIHCTLATALHLALNSSHVVFLRRHRYRHRSTPTPVDLKGQRRRDTAAWARNSPVAIQPSAKDGVPTSATGRNRRYGRRDRDAHHAASWATWIAARDRSP